MKSIPDDIKKEIEDYRTIWGFNSEFSTVLAAPFLKGCAKKYEGDYDRIGNAVRGLGKRIFLPSFEIKPDWPEANIVDVLKIVATEADLAILYPAPVNDEAFSLVLNHYIRILRIPTIIFNPLNLIVPGVYLKNNIFDSIKPTNFDQGLEKLVLSVKKFYKSHL